MYPNNFINTRLIYHTYAWFLSGQSLNYYCNLCLFYIWINYEVVWNVCLVAYGSNVEQKRAHTIDGSVPWNWNDLNCCTHSSSYSFMFLEPKLAKLQIQASAVWYRNQTANARSPSVEWHSELPGNNQLTN